MDAAQSTVKVLIRKTVQVKQYEPTVVELSEECICNKMDAATVRDGLFQSLKAEMNRIFGTEQKNALDALK